MFEEFYGEFCGGEFNSWFEICIGVSEKIILNSCLKLLKQFTDGMLDSSSVETLSKWICISNIKCLFRS
jgi:hypothetical protein